MATIPLIIIGVFVVAKISKPISENQQASLDSLNRISRENLSGIRVIRAFDNDAYEQQRLMIPMRNSQAIPKSCLS